MKTTKRLLSLIITLVIAVGMFTMSAHAATANAAVSVSSATVKPNSSFTVTVRVSSSSKLGSVEGLMSYDASKVEFVSGEGVSGAGGRLTMSQYIGEGANEFKFTMSFKAVAEGSSSFSFASTEISDYDFNPVENISASASISVVADKPLSSNNNLKSLKLSSGALSPTFSKSVLNYTVNVPNGTTTMYLTPEVEDSTAKAVVSGSSSLQVGTNTRKVTVTAQNGSTKVYTIKIVRAAAEGQSTPSEQPTSDPPVSNEEPQDTTIFIDGVKMTVIEDLSSVQVPAGFTATVTKLGQREVMAVTDQSGKIVMLCLADEAGNKSFYIYNSTDISYYPYIPLTINGQSFIPLSKPESIALPDGFSPTEVTIAEKAYGAWVCNDQDEFYLMYLFNAKSESLFYLYDSVEGTLQRYIGTAAGGMSNSSSNPITSKPIIERYDSLFGRIGLFAVIALGAAVIALSVLLIVMLSKGKRKKWTNKTAPLSAENDTPTFEDDFVLPKD